MCPQGTSQAALCQWPFVIQWFAKRIHYPTQPGFVGIDETVTFCQVNPRANTDPFKGGDLDEWRAILRQPRIAIRLGALYFSIANAQHDLQMDPVLCYAAYNAGSPRFSDKTPFGVHYYRKKLDDGRWADAMTNFLRWHNDSVAAYGVCY